MAFAFAVDPLTPAGTDLVSQGDDQIRNLKSAIRERVNSFFVDVDTDPWVIKASARAAGPLIVGASDPGGTETLRVNGKVRATSLVTSGILELVTDANTSIDLYTNGGIRWRVSGAGHLIAGADNTYDIGAAGATRPRSVYVSDVVIVGADPGGTEKVRVTGGVRATAASAFTSSLAVTGPIVIGTDPGGADILRVGGNVRVSQIYASSKLSGEALEIGSAPSGTEKSRFEGVIRVGSGIAFPATQAASADANTLDDYEEGTFTPSLRFGGLSTGITYGTQNASYTKIGAQVFFDITIGLTSKGTATGQADVSGLPFAAGRQTTVIGGGNSLSTVGPSDIIAFTSAASAVLALRKPSGTNWAVMTEADFTSTSTLQISGHYRV